MSAHDKIDTVRTMAETMVKIDAVDIPPIEIPETDVPEELKEENIMDELDENIGDIMRGYIEDKKVEIKDTTIEEIDIDGVEEWWDAWCEVREIIDEAFEGDVEGGNCATIDEDDQYDGMRVSTDFINLSIDIYAGGDVLYVAEYAIDMGSNLWGMLYEGSPYPDGLDQIELGREVARAELAIITNTTESTAETIDYWQTEFGRPKWNQTSWAEVRGVGRQTVNDRVRSAVDSLND